MNHTLMVVCCACGEFIPAAAQAAHRIRCEADRQHASPGELREALGDVVDLESWAREAMADADEHNRFTEWAMHCATVRSEPRIWRLLCPPCADRTRRAEGGATIDVHEFQVRQLARFGGLRCDDCGGAPSAGDTDAA